MSVFEIVRKAMLAGFGVQEMVTDFVGDLVKKGELSESQGAKLVKEWSERAEKTTDEVNKTVTELVNGALSRMKLPTAEEIRNLTEKVQTLSTRVAKLEDELAGRDTGKED